MIERNRAALTVVAGALAGLAAGLTTSLVLFEVLDFGNLTSLGYAILIVARGIVFGTSAGGFSGFLCLVKTRPFGAPVAALAGAICGSLAIFLPFPFHLPPEVMDLLMEPDSLVAP